MTSGGRYRDSRAGQKQPPPTSEDAVTRPQHADTKIRLFNNNYINNTALLCPSSTPLGPQHCSKSLAASKA